MPKGMIAILWKSKHHAKYKPVEKQVASRLNTFNLSLTTILSFYSFSYFIEIGQILPIR